MQTPRLPRVLSVTGLLALGIASFALAAEPSVTIVPSAKTDGGSSQGGGGTSYEAENIKLARALGWIYPGGLDEGGDIAALPDTRFDIKIKGYPTRSTESFDALAKQIKAQFAVTIDVIESEKDGFQVEIPATAKLTKAGEDEGHSISTVNKGWSLKAVTAPQLAKWLSRELERPVIVAGDTTTKFNIEIENSPFKPKELPAALNKLGVSVTPAKAKVKLLKASK